MAPKKFVPVSNHANAAWKLNSLVLCRYLETPDDVYYEAKIINITHDDNGGFVYRVHYQGWNNRYDEDIPDSDANLRFRAHTEQAVTEAKETIKNVLQQSKGKKSIRKSLDSGDCITSTPSPSVLSDPYKKTYRTSGASVHQNLSAKRSSVTISAPAHKRRNLGSGDKLNHQTEKTPEALKFENVTLFDELAGVLKMDNLMVKEMFFLPILPVKYTIDMILDKYRTYLEEQKQQQYQQSDEELSITSHDANMEFALGLRDYFNVLLKSRFLYAFERDRHERYVSNLQKNGEKVEMSSHYGLPHLLRLIVRLSETLSSSNIPCNPMTVAVMKYRSTVFVHFLHRHWNVFFNGKKDYEPASLSYMSHAASFSQEPSQVLNVNNIAVDQGTDDLVNDNSNKENEYIDYESPIQAQCS